MKLPSSCEWTASYRSASTRRIAVSASAASSGTLASDGPMPTLTEEGRTQAPEDPQPRQGDVRPERIRDQVDGVPEIDECPDAVVLAERGAPGLEEGLRRNHEDFHRVEPGNCRKAEAERST